MSEIDRVAIRARLNAATPGPWTYHPGTASSIIEGPMPPNPEDRFDVWPDTLFRVVEQGADGEFAAHARTDVEALLDLADDLEKEVQRLRERSNAEKHYAEAERLLSLADRDVSSNWTVLTGESKSDVIAAAQVHATLAMFPTVEGGDDRG